MNTLKVKQNIKLMIDILMTVCLFVLMCYQYVGDKNHEIAGTIMFVLFLIHNVLNYKWYMNLQKGKYSLVRTLQIIINVLVFANMIGLMISGIILSRYVFVFLPVIGKVSFARNLHMVTS